MILKTCVLFISSLAGASLSSFNNLPGYFYPSQRQTWVQKPLAGTFGDAIANFNNAEGGPDAIATHKEAVFEYMMNHLGITDRTTFETISAYENSLN